MCWRKAGCLLRSTSSAPALSPVGLAVGPSLSLSLSLSIYHFPWCPLAPLAGFLWFPMERVQERVSVAAFYSI